MPPSVRELKKKPESTGQRPPSKGKRPRKKDYLAERTYRSLRERIYTGYYRPGEHLKEEVLVKSLAIELAPSGATANAVSRASFESAPFIRATFLRGV